jgi:hypothetical protein
MRMRSLAAALVPYSLYQLAAAMILVGHTIARRLNPFEVSPAVSSTLALCRQPKPVDVASACLRELAMLPLERRNGRMLVLGLYSFGPDDLRSNKTGDGPTAY